MMTGEMTKTVFGEVLAELMAKRGIPATLAGVAELAEGAGTEGFEGCQLLLARIEGTSTEHPGDATMAALSEGLKLTGQERRKLAFAFTYEVRPPRYPEVPEMTDEQVKVLWSRIQRLDAINTAIATVEDNPQPNPGVQEETLEELRTLSEEVNNEVKRIKREYGFKD